MSGGGRPRPYFFLSYARLPQQRFNPRANPNKPLTRLFGNLCRNILNMTDCSESEAGFMDQGMDSGDRWPDRLADALATCKVFVPVYSPRYFTSEECGKEWAAFLHRVHAQRDAEGREPQAIVPLVWHPVPVEQLPVVARPIQYSLQNAGERYLRDGFHGLTELPRLWSHLRDATYQIARRIVTVAETTNVAPCEPLPYDQLTSVFGDYGVRRPLKVTVIAAIADALPEGRNAFYYGRVPAQWSPFRDQDDARPLADLACELAEEHGYQAEVVGFEQYMAQMLGSGEPEGPELMLLDPWQVTRPGARDELLRLDASDRPWISVVVPWNRSDPQTKQVKGDLENRLHEALPRKYDSPESRDVVSVEAFRDAFPEIVARAASHFFRSVRTFPPSGQKGRRPRLLEDQ
ncbi:TIR-like protein FxsC [Nonomuraea ferruginea]|uniref:TIR-like protein FxsC n=2 Tax=Streptosporangiaceae TaxID=2004 RepID=A0ABT4SRG1_9ACTN|nr:TIR-like protein FxsC [Nonomuraea ferruginea]MDA0639431.1 TIR-like protein FxsC [Nonomuraea ferruginea]